MKKVFHLYKTFSPYTHGGVEKYIESIINSQSKFNHQILSIGNNKLSNSKKIKQFIQNELKVYCQNGQYIEDQIGTGSKKL